MVKSPAHPQCLPDIPNSQTRLPHLFDCCLRQFQFIYSPDIIDQTCRLFLLCSNIYVRLFNGLTKLPEISSRDLANRTHGSCYIYLHPRSDRDPHRISGCDRLIQWSPYIPLCSCSKLLRSAHTVYSRVLYGFQNKHDYFSTQCELIGF